MSSIVVVGAGNVGSQLVHHLGRMAGVGSVTIVDRDVYEASNLSSQDITRRDVGQPKAIVQAGRLCRIAPGLRIVAVHEAVEHVPIGLLRADVLLACLDSRAARRTVNDRAWRLGVPWIDAGVRRDDLLARVNVWLPGDDRPCYECGLDGDDEPAPAHPCAADETPASTAAPSALGALAASLQALECGKLLAGDVDHVAVSRQVTISARAHRHQVTRFVRDPDCRFDHAIWAITSSEHAPGSLTLRDASALAAGERFRVAGQTFVTGLVCVACGTRRDLGLRLLGRLAAAVRACPDCGATMRPDGGDVLEWLPVGALPPAFAGASLASLGVRAGDVLRFTAGADATHVELGGAG